MVIEPLDDHAYCTRSAFTHLGLWRKLYDIFIASLHNQPMYPKMCYINIFVNLQPVGWNLKKRLFAPLFGEFEGHPGWGWAHSIIRFPLTHMVYLSISYRFCVISLERGRGCWWLICSVRLPARPTRIGWQIPLQKLSRRRATIITIKSIFYAASCLCFSVCC